MAANGYTIHQTQILFNNLLSQVAIQSNSKQEENKAPKMPFITSYQISGSSSIVQKSNRPETNTMELKETSNFKHSFLPGPQSSHTDCFSHKKRSYILL